jgi:hypothetical protein
LSQSNYLRKRESLIQQGKEANQTRCNLDRGIDSRIYAQMQGAWGMWPGMATYYERHGRSHTYDPDLKATLDAASLTTQGREVETTWTLGVNSRDA